VIIITNFCVIPHWTCVFLASSESLSRLFPIFVWVHPFMHQMHYYGLCWLPKTPCFRISLGHLKNNFKHPRKRLNSSSMYTIESRCFELLGCFLLHRTLQTFLYRRGPVLQLHEWIYTTLFNKLPGAFNLYKTRERIHRSVADLRLLPIPRSWGRIAAPNPHWETVWWD